jgi:hypothetical protein
VPTAAPLHSFVRITFRHHLTDEQPFRVARNPDFVLSGVRRLIFALVAGNVGPRIFLASTLCGDGDKPRHSYCTLARIVHG